MISSLPKYIPTHVLKYFSFKARGACNVLTSMTASEKSKGVTVSGSRNFILAMSHYGFRQSVPINVVVPKDCALLDKQRYKENFALVKVHGNDTNDASLHALSYSNEIGTNYVHGFVKFVRNLVGNSCRNYSSTFVPTSQLYCRLQLQPSKYSFI